MEKEYGFDYANSLGKKGEFIFINEMNKMGYKISDVSSMKEYQEQDIDFIYVSKSGKIQTYEIKYDTVIHKTNNIFLEYEIIFNDDKSKINGYLKKCKADILIYIDAINNKFYVIKFNRLKLFLENNKERIQTKTRKDNMDRKNKKGREYVSYGYIININDLIKNNVVTKIIKYPPL